MSFSEQLLSLRQQIDTLTQELYDVLDERMGVVHQVGELKHRNLDPNKPATFYRGDREALMLRDMLDRSFAHLAPDKAAKLLKEVISMSLSVEATQRVAFVHQSQDLSSMAAIDRFGHQAAFKPCRTIEETIDCLLAGHGDHAVLALTAANLDKIDQAVTTQQIFTQSVLHYATNEHYHPWYLILSTVPPILTEDAALDLSLFDLTLDSDTTKLPELAVSNVRYYIDLPDAEHRYVAVTNWQASSARENWINALAPHAKASYLGEGLHFGDVLNIPLYQ